MEDVVVSDALDASSPSPAQPESSSSSPDAPAPSSEAPSSSSDAPAAAPADAGAIDCFVGIDLGSGHTVVSLLDADRAFPALAVNDLSNRSTPTIVSFRDGRVFVGEAGAFGLVRSPGTTFASFKADLGREEDATRTRSIPFSLLLPNVNEPELGADDQLDVSPVDLCALFFHHLVGDLRRYEAMRPGRRAVATRIAVPTHFSAKSRELVVMAAQLAGLPAPQCVSEADALALCYHRRHHNEDSDKAHQNKEKSVEKSVEKPAEETPAKVPEDVEMTPSDAAYVLLVDVGERYTSVLACAEGSPRVLAEHTIDGGAGDMDAALAALGAAEFEKKFREEGVLKNARFLQRFLAAADRAKHVLSTLDEAFLEVENVRDHDLKLKVTRAQLEERCAPYLARLSDALQAVLTSPALQPLKLTACELVGGGTRIPCVQHAIREALPAEVPLSHTLDSSAAVSFGASLLCHDAPSAAPSGFPLSDPQGTFFANSLSLFQRLLTKHQYVISAEETLNRVEALLAHSREHSQDKAFAALFTPQAQAALDAVLGRWRAWADDHGACQDFEFLTQNLGKAEAEVADAVPGLREALERREEERREALREAERRQAEKLEKGKGGERAAARRAEISTPKERLEISEKLRAQGNAAFKDLDYEGAAGKYVAALGVLSGAHDVPVDVQAEMDELKQVCYVNLGVCYLKLEKFDRAVEQCNLALKLNAENVKALFRRGQAYNRLKMYENAVVDLKAAVALEPKGKEAVKELQIAEVGVKAQKEKQQKMYAKMFA